MLFFQLSTFIQSLNDSCKETIFLFLNCAQWGRFVKEICKRARWVKFSKAVKPIWKVIKFRLLHCSWAHHPEMEPEFQTNAICTEKSTRGPVFQRCLESCSCHGDSYRQIFKEPKHPVYQGLLKDTDHLFYIPKRTSFENLVQQEVSEPLWDPMGGALVMGTRGCCCGHLWTLSHHLEGQEHAGCTGVASPCSILHTRQVQHPGDRGVWAMEIISWRAWLFAKGVTFVILPQYDFPL